MRGILSVILIIILILGVSGCMSNEVMETHGDHQDASFERMKLGALKTEFLSILEKKYGETFEMDKLLREFNGEKGVYYRAVFHSTNRPDKGVLYCYSQGEGTAVQIDGIDCVLTDNYANAILQERYAANLQKALGDSVLVKCRLFTPNHTVTDEDFAAGLEACLENTDLTPHLFIYVFADPLNMNESLLEEAEQFVGKLNT